MKQRKILRQAFDQAVIRCQADSVLAEFLPEVPKRGRLIIVGAGKAAGQMAAAAERHYGEHLTGDQIGGLIVVPEGAQVSLQCLELLHAAHPVPDDSSELAARRMLQTVQGLAAEDQVLMLLSGGASSLLCAPIQGINLNEKRTLTKDLLTSGATINEINIVRTCLSDIKGGKLARACWPASVTTLAISDVVGDQPEVIGSGPTVDVSIASGQLQDIANKYDLSLPHEITTLVSDSPAFASQPFPTSTYRIIVRPMDALHAAATVAEKHGYDVVILGDAIEGEAKKVASTIAAECRRGDYKDRKVALLSGGEVTVTFDQSCNASYGGSNREFALALALELPAASRIAALIADTDGVDGRTGRNGPVAGAVVDSNTVNRGAAIGLDANEFLTDHNSGTYFEKLQDEVITGPTNTNVNDFRMILIN